MIEKGLFIIIVMYCLSFALLTGQWFADSFGVTMTSISGAPIKANVLGIINTDFLNTITLNVTQTNQTTIVQDPVQAAAEITLQLFQLMTGTYIFNLLLLFDIPLVLVGGMVMVYAFLLIRALIGYLRGV